MARINPAMPPSLKLDGERMDRAGLARLDGKHLRLITDVRDGEAIRQLVLAFDAAVPQWCRWFEIEEERTGPWRLTAIVMASPDSIDRFREAGLIPEDLPPFPAGYNRGHELWMYWQPGDYYTRHLLLHEGTHGFMQWFLRGSGPPWYSEGMAEMLALHRWDDNRLELGIPSVTREGTPYWGRPKIIRRDVAAGKGRSLEQVLTIPGFAFRNVENYAWAWAACRFLNQHPLSAAKFQSMSSLANRSQPDFNAALRSGLKAVWKELEREWRLYLQEMEYGYSIGSARIVEAKTTNEGWEISAGRGWQRTGIRLEAGDSLTLKAKGRFKIRDGSPPWFSEANGVTIEYYRGQPLGVLQAVVLGDDPSEWESWPVQQIGAEGTVRAERSGELALRINDHPAQRADNDGTLSVYRAAEGHVSQ